MVAWHRTGKTICALIIYNNCYFRYVGYATNTFQNVRSELSSNVPISVNCSNPAKSMVLSVRKCYALVFHSSHPRTRTTLGSLSKYDHRFANMQ